MGSRPITDLVQTLVISKKTYRGVQMSGCTFILVYNYPLSNWDVQLSGVQLSGCAFILAPF